MRTKRVNDGFVLSVARGEKIIDSIRAFCGSNRIFGGHFSGIGAVDDLELAHYDVDTKKYSSRKFALKLEIASLSGNIAVAGDEIVVHCHGVFSNEQMQPVAWHLVEARVAAACEIFLFPAPRLVKRLDEKIGLKMLEL